MCIRRQVTARVADYPAELAPYAEALRGRSMLCRRLGMLPVELSLIHISEPTRRTPLYSSAASDVYKETGDRPGGRLPGRARAVRRGVARSFDALPAVGHAAGGAVSYTHLRAHETDTSLFVGSVRCV